VVPNRPGVIAEIALTLGREGINISDMALTPSPDNTRGEIALWVGEGEAARAQDLLEGLGFPVTA
jgi:prephenate dehydrogenase